MDLSIARREFHPLRHKKTPQGVFFLLYCYLLQSMIIRTDIFIMTILHTKAFRNCSELNETEPFIKMPCMDICRHYSIELKNTKAVLLSLKQTIRNKLFADVQSPALRFNSIACIADMTAPAHIIRMQDIQTINVSIFRISSNSAIGLRSKKFLSAFIV